MTENLSDNLSTIARRILTPLGYELLDVQVQNPDRNPVVVVRMDRLDEQPVAVTDVQRASKALGLELDAVDPIAGEYSLELESPGAKRPLIRARHFERMLGLKARVRGGGHSFTAPISGVSGEQVTFDTPDGPITLTVGDFQANLAEFPPSHR